MKDGLIHSHAQRGQTLIETVTAVFILVMGISTAVGLGIYAYRSADDSTKVIVGTSLAREGVEAVKNQRDSNWVSDSFRINNNGTECTFSGGTTQQPCDETWLNNLNTGTYAIDTYGTSNSTSGITFTPSPSSYALQYCPSTQSYASSTSGAPSCSGGYQSTIYSRKLVLASNVTNNNVTYTTSDASTGATQPAFLSAVVTVWWTSRHCSPTNDPSTLPSSCKIILEEHLTNWQKTFKST